MSVRKRKGTQRQSVRQTDTHTHPTTHIRTHTHTYVFAFGIFGVVLNMLKTLNIPGLNKMYWDNYWEKVGCMKPLRTD